MSDKLPKCRTCQRLFSVSRRTGVARHSPVYCSKKCTNTRAIISVTEDVSCRNCGKVFIPLGSMPPKNFRKRKFCSKRCSGVHSWCHRQKLRVERFWDNVAVSDEESCWPWLGHRGRDCKGRIWHGKIRWCGKSTGAHRVAFLLTFGKITEGLHILHSCDNPPCCNPSHLREGTPLDNAQDMVQRQRLSVRARDENPATKIKSTEYRKLVTACKDAKRDRYNRVEKGTIPILANKFLVSRHIVKRAMAEAMRSTAFP